LSFFHRPALQFLRAWSHTRMYAPGARKNCALSGEKNPALTHQAGYSRFNIPPHLILISRQRRCRMKSNPNFVPFGSDRAKAVA